MKVSLYFMKLYTAIINILPKQRMVGHVGGMVTHHFIPVHGIPSKLMFAVHLLSLVPTASFFKKISSQNFMPWCTIIIIERFKCA